MLQDEIIKLNPIIEADPILFSMDTLGWKIMFILAILLIIIVTYKFYLKYKRNAYRREAINQIEIIIQGDKNAIHVLISQIMFLLKQTALQTYDRKTVASLEGEKWLVFLDSKINKSFFIKHQHIISSAIYKNEYDKNKAFNLNDFTEMSINWIKNHA